MTVALPTAEPPRDHLLAYCLVDDHGRALTSSSPDEPFYAASTIKLLVLSTLLSASAADRVSLASQVSVAGSFTGSDGTSFQLTGDHVDPAHPHTGARVSLRELAHRMIARSSNEATNQLVELLGFDACRAEAQRLSLTSATRLERLIGDASALKAGLTNTVSARDLTTLLRAVTTSTLPRAEAECAWAALSDQQIPIIGRALLPGIRWGSKSGWVDGYRHDGASIQTPTGLVHLAVLTRGWDEEEADRAIMDVTRRLLPDLCR